MYSPARNPLVMLFVILMVTAVVVVKLRQDSRVMYAQLQKLQTERDLLNVEWGQLLLEEGAWSQHRRIEAMARAQLGMQLPSSQQLHVMALPGSTIR